MGTFEELAASKLDFTELLASADETSDKPEEAKETFTTERSRALSLGNVSYD